MTLILKIKQGHSAEAIVISGVLAYQQTTADTYFITYRDKGELWDIVVKEVQEVKEVR